MDGLHSQLADARAALQQSLRESDEKLAEQEDAHKLVLEKHAAAKRNSEQRLIAAMEAAQVGFDSQLDKMRQEHDEQMKHVMKKADSALKPLVEKLTTEKVWD